MTAIADLALNSVVYKPSNRIGSTGFVWTDRTSAYPAGQGEVSFTGATPKDKAGRVKRVGFRLNMPAVASESDACACAGSLVNENIVTIYVDVDTASSLTQRTDLLARIASLVASTPFGNAVKNLEGVY